MTCLDDDLVLGLVEGRVAAHLLVEVDAHLDDCASCRDVIAQLARTRTGVERGKAIGRYVIGDLLGAGAMGRVYSAWEPELDRRVAVKLLRDDSADARARLLREAQAMARLNHPNVVTVHEVGTTDDGVFVAMELVEGRTLRAWADGQSWRDRLAVLVDVARGLAAVHAAGVVHRDVKPDNIIVGDDRRVRLGDFGLARSGGAPATRVDASRLAIGTPSTAIAGTPAYMAPELLRGGSADAASDQFSFGVTAYEVLAGTRPFAGRTWAEIAEAIARGDIAPVAAPRWVDAAIRRCLADDPARRFAGMDAVAGALASRLGRRRPVAWIAAAVGFAGAATVATWIASRPAAAPASCAIGEAELASVWSPHVRDALAATWRDAPDAPAALAALDGWTARWIAERDASCRDGGVGSIPATERLASTGAGGAAGADVRVRCLDQRRAEFAAVVARLDAGSVDRVVDAVAALTPPGECRLASLGADPAPADRAARVQDVTDQLAAVRAAVALGDSRPVVDRAVALAGTARTLGHAPTLADALLAEADALRGADRFADAAAAARDALAAAERGHDDLAAARAWLARVALADELRLLDQADDFGAVAAGAVDRAGAPDRLAGLLLRLRGTVAYDRGKLADARELLVAARARLAALDARSLDVAAVDSALGSVARAAGDLDEAERRHRAALAVDRERRGPRHPDVARDLHNLAGVLRLRGDLDAAAATYKDALAIEIATRGERSAEAGLTHNSLGLVAMAKRDWPTARAELALALAALTAADHGDRAFAEHNLGLVAAAQGDHPAALVHFARAEAIYRATIGGDAASTIRLDLDRAHSELALGHGAAARTLATKARDAARRTGVTWIADDAAALVAGIVVAKPAAVVSVDPPLRTPGNPTLGSAAPTNPVPSPPTPIKDVGVYGASHP